MMYQLLLLATTLFLQPYLGAQAMQVHDRKAKKFSIDLDIAPNERWSDLINAHKMEVMNIMKSLRTTLPLMLTDAFSKITKEVIQDLVPYPYNEEILGIAKILDDITVGDVLMANLYYELAVFSDYNAQGTQSSINDAIACTSIVAEAMNGTIVHGRNMDYGFQKYLENITVTVDFLKGGNISYTGTTFAGYVGLITGQKPYKYTISLNERDEGQPWMNILEAWMSGMDAAVSFSIRDVLAQDYLSFNGAVDVMSYKPFIAPCYIIMGGVQSGEGVVITRSRTDSISPYRLSVNTGTWYVLETNYDRWTTPPPGDDRRDPAIKAMEVMTRTNVSGPGLYNVLSTPPILNEQTTYSVIMSAANPQMYTTWIRHHG